MAATDHGMEPHQQKKVTGTSSEKGTASASVNLKDSETFTTPEMSKNRRSNQIINHGVSVRMVAVAVLGLLAISYATEAKTIKNTEMVDVALTICHVILRPDRTSPPTRMAEFLTAIANQWPLGDNRMRLGVVESQGSGRFLVGVRLVVKIPNGTLTQNVIGMLSKLVGNPASQDFPFGDNAGADVCRTRRDFLDGARQAHLHEDRRRPTVPMLQIHVTVIRSTENFNGVNEWIQNRFKQEIEGQWKRNDAGYPDAVVVFETGASDIGGIAWKNESGPQELCCKYNVTELAEDLLAAVQNLLGLCPLEVNQRCYFNNDETVANVTYVPKPKPEFVHLCWNRTAEIGVEIETCKKASSSVGDTPPATAPITVPAVTSIKPRDSRNPLLYVCIAALILAVLVAVAIIVRQTIAYRREKKKREEKLVECGRICMSKKGKSLLSKKGSVKLSAGMTTMTTGTTVSPAVLESRK